MITLQDLLDVMNESRSNYKNVVLILHIFLNNQLFPLHLNKDNLEISKAIDIIKQAFPFCLNILESDTSIESIRKSQIKTTVTAKVDVNTPQILPYHYFKYILNGTESDLTNEWSAYNMASILFTYFHNNQIEEFNSTWEAMYANWKRFEVNKI